MYNSSTTCPFYWIFRSPLLFSFHLAVFSYSVSQNARERCFPPLLCDAHGIVVTLHALLYRSPTCLSPSRSYCNASTVFFITRATQCRLCLSITFVVVGMLPDFFTKDCLWTVARDCPYYCI